MILLDALKFFGFSVGISATFGFVFGVLIFWVPKNINVD